MLLRGGPSRGRSPGWRLRGPLRLLTRPTPAQRRFATGAGRSASRAGASLSLCRGRCLNGALPLDRIPRVVDDSDRSTPAITSEGAAHVYVLELGPATARAASRRQVRAATCPTRERPEHPRVRCSLRQRTDARHDHPRFRRHGYTQDPARLTLRRATGADAILRKPFELRDLKALTHPFLGDRSDQTGVVEWAAVSHQAGPAS